MVMKKCEVCGENFECPEGQDFRTYCRKCYAKKKSTEEQDPTVLLKRIQTEIEKFFGAQQVQK